MGRSNTTDAARRAEAVRAYKTANPDASLRAIAAEFGMSSPAGVKKILDGEVKAEQAGKLWEGMQQIIDEKRREAASNLRQYGVYSAIGDLMRGGYRREEIPGEATIARWIAAIEGTKVAKVSAKSSNRLQYWAEARPTRANERALIDTATTTIADTSVTILLYVDWFSRAAHAEIVPLTFARYLPWFFTRSFEATGGVPHTLQSDNGFGFIQTGYNSLSKAQQSAFLAGVQRWEYVPVAEATRNGRVERLVQTVKGYLEARTWSSVLEARIALAHWLDDYNTQRVHKGISNRRKGGWCRPADLCNYNHQLVENPRVIKPDTSKGIPPYEIVYKRFVMSGCVVIPAPHTFIPVSNQLTGRYVDIIIYNYGQQGRIEYHETNNGSIITHLIGTFDGLAPQVYVRQTGQDSQFRPIPTDEQALLRSQSKHLKTRKPRPGWVMPGISRRDIGPAWQLVDDATDEVLYDSRYCNDVDHLQEIAQ